MDKGKKISGGVAVQFDVEEQPDEVQQFQSTYFTLKELKPELFSDDVATKLIKVDGFIENL